MSQVNATAFPGPYVDQSITKRNPPAQTIVPTPPHTGPTDTGTTEVYDVPEVDHEPDNSAAPDHPVSPNRWLPGRDPYAVGGAKGQTFFDHS